MRILLAIVITLAAAWAGYWFIGSGALRSGVAAWFDARRAEGWQASYSDLSIQGFPSRFDTSLSDIALADPASGLGWRAPFFQVLTLSYTPNRAIAVWPREQRIDTPQGSYALTSEDMRASLHVAASTAMALERGILTAEGITITAENGGNGAFSIGALRLAAEQAGTEPGVGRPRYHLGLAADGVAPPAPLLARGDALPRVIDSVAADVTVTFDKPWDRHALEDARPQPTQIVIKSAEIRWGQMTLAASGVLDVGPGGQPDGTLTVTARNWRKMLETAADATLVTPEMAQTAERALTVFAGTGEAAKSLEVPLRFDGGRVWIGPIPIADTPVLRLN